MKVSAVAYMTKMSDKKFRSFAVNKEMLYDILNDMPRQKERKNV